MRFGSVSRTRSACVAVRNFGISMVIGAVLSERSATCGVAGGRCRALRRGHALST